MSLELNECPSRATRLSEIKLLAEPRPRLFFVFASAIVIAAIASHLVASWVKIKTTAAQAFTIGQSQGLPTFLAGSSVSAYGIQWSQISTQMNLFVRVWGIAGGSPFEWEQFQKQVPEAKTTFIVVSAVDLDESLVSDFRAAIVPLKDTLKALVSVTPSLAFTKRVLSQYPVTWLRALFPTLGRSRGVMGDINLKIRSLLRPSSRTSETEAGPTVKFGSETVVDEYKLQRMSDWSDSKIISKLAAMRVTFQGAHSFDGVKSSAFKRMLEYATQKGQTVVIVLPMSPAYSKEFMPAPISKVFEDALASLQEIAPKSQWLRLDHLSDLSRPENFCDLAHMNVFGQQIATDELQRLLRQSRNN